MQQDDKSMQGQKFAILEALYRYSKDSQLSCYDIVMKFGKGVLNAKDFETLVRQIYPQSSIETINTLYDDILYKYKAKGITSYVLDELLRKMANYDEPVKYRPKQVERSREAQEIFALISKTLQRKNQALKKVFPLFDQDQDGQLNDKEFEFFIKFFVPTVNADEMTKLNGSRKKNWSLYQLMSVIQDGAAMTNSVKNEQPQVKLVEKPAGARQMIMESNVFEDTNKMMDSNIKFDELVISKQTCVSGMKEMVQQFALLKSSKREFQDKDFPASQSSLGNQLTHLGIEWKRPSQIWKEFGVFIKDATESRVGLGKWISPSDIQQGELGDCYFLSVLSSLSCRWPDVVMELFLTRRVNAVGMYCIRLCIDGEWQAIVVDDWIPCKGNRPAFTQSGQKELWVLIMEKAWAKVFGSYSNIIAGNSKEVMSGLVCGPTWSISTNGKSFRSEFEGCIQRRCLMTVGSLSAGEEGMTRSVQDKKGLVAGHAYSILKIRDVEHPKLGKVRLVKLRNPWGEKEWNGDWSDSSPLWTAQLREVCKMTKERNDGVFYMDWDNFIRYFDEISVCYFNKDYQYTSLNLVSNRRKALYFQVDIQSEGEYYFIVNQKNQRFFKNYNNYSYAPIRILLTKKSSGNNYQYQEAKQSADHQVWAGGLITKGTYIIQVKIVWGFWDEHDFNFGVYGQQLVKIKQINPIPQLPNMAYLAKAKANKNRKQYQNDPKVVKAVEFSIEEGFGYMYFENNGAKTLESQVVLKNLQGLRLVKPDRGNSFKVHLGPGENKLVVAKVDSKGFAYALEEQFMLR